MGGEGLPAAQEGMWQVAPGGDIQYQAGITCVFLLIHISVIASIILLHNCVSVSRSSCPWARTAFHLSSLP